MEKENEYQSHNVQYNWYDVENDPPTGGSKVLSSPPRRRVPLEPVPTYHLHFASPLERSRLQDTSILLGTAFADCDLNDKTQSTSPVRDDDEEGQHHGTTNRGRTLVRRPPPIPIPATTSSGSTAPIDNVPTDDDVYSNMSLSLSSLHLPPTPADGALPPSDGGADDAQVLDVIATRRPESPRDVKEWLQTAMVALHEARKERDAARQWARDMRSAVQKWAEEKRKLIRCETSGSADALYEREMQVRIQFQALTHLESMIHTLQQDFHSTQSQRQASDAQMQQLLLEQQARIQSLTQALASLERTLSEGLSTTTTQSREPSPRSEVSTSPAFRQRGTGGNRDETIPAMLKVEYDEPQSTTTVQSRAKTISHNNSSNRKSVQSNASASSTATARIRKPLPDGADGHVIVYSSGVEKEIHKDGTTVIRFTNGDVETNFGNTVAYFHSSEQVLQITNTKDGSVLLEYPNGQIERHYDNGTKSILFPDGTKAKLSADGKMVSYQRRLR